MSHSQQQHPPPRQQQPVTPFREATWLQQHQHKGKQFQTQGSSPKTGKQPDGRDLQHPRSGHPVAGNQPEATDNPAGAPRPVYDQYEVKSPQNMHHDEADDAARREQAMQVDDHKKGTARNADGSKAPGYGSDDADEKQPPADTEKDVTDEKDGIEEKPDNSQSERGYG